MKKKKVWQSFRDFFGLESSFILSLGIWNDLRTRSSTTPKQPDQNISFFFHALLPPNMRYYTSNKLISMSSFLWWYSSLSVFKMCCHGKKKKKGVNISLVPWSFPPSSPTTRRWVVSSWQGPTVARPVPSSPPSATARRSPAAHRWRSHGRKTAQSGTQSSGLPPPSPGSLHSVGGQAQIFLFIYWFFFITWCGAYSLFASFFICLIILYTELTLNGRLT